MARRKRKNPGGGEMEIVLLIGAAGLAYWWYTSSSGLPTGVPSTGNANGYYPAGGGTLAAPKTNDLWLSIPGTSTVSAAALTAAVVAIYNGTAWIPFTASPTASPTTSVSSPIVPVSTPVASVPVSAPAVSPPTVNTPALATIGANLQAAMTAGGDPAISIVSGVPSATPYVFNYYLVEPSVSGGAIATAPDVSLVFPGVNLTNPMTFSQYWGGMGPYLTSHLGLSGMRGMGFRPRSPYFAGLAGGWRT
jgi:hypothetical protein